jgi:hypothetical protein
MSIPIFNNKRNKTMSKPIVKWDKETSTGLVPKKAIFKTVTPDEFKDLTPDEVFTKVDQVREAFATTLTNEVMDYALNQPTAGSGEGLGVSVSGVNAGGHTTLNCYVDPCFKVVTEVKTEFVSEAYKEILAKQGTVFEKFNITRGDTDD